MPFLVTRTAYLFKELSSQKSKENAKAYVRSLLDEEFSDYGASDLAYNLSIELLGFGMTGLPEKGQPTPSPDAQSGLTIEWNLSGGQGDGVAFYGYLDLEVYADHEETPDDVKRAISGLLEMECGSYIAIERRPGWRYDNENSMILSDEPLGEPICEAYIRAPIAKQKAILDDRLDFIATIMDHLHERIKRVSMEMKEYGQGFIDGWSSDEAVMDRIDNDGDGLLFDEFGNAIRGLENQTVRKI